MSPTPSLVELRSRLRTLGRETMLEMSVADVRAAIADAEVGDILSYIADHLRAKTFGELLANPEAQKVIDGALSATNRAWVLETLSAFVGTKGTGPKRATPRPFRSSVPEPDRAPARVEEWAITHGVGKLLDQPASVVRPFLERPSDFARARVDPTATVSDFLHRKRLPDGLRAHAHLASGYADAARAYLKHAADRRAWLVHLGEMTSRAPDSLALRTLSAHLRDALRAGQSHKNADAPLLAIQDVIVVEPDPPVIRSTFRPPTRAEWSQPVETSIAIAGFESVPPRIACSCDGADASNAEWCAHRRTLVEQVLEILHDAGQILHPALVEVTSVPTWRRFVDRLADKLGPKSRESVAEQRLVFRIDRDGGPELVRPAIQKRLRTGHFSAGTVVPVEKIAGDPDLVRRIDQPIVDALLGASVLRRARLGPRAEAARDAAALRALVGHPRVYANDEPERPIRVVEKPLTVALVPEGEGVRLEFRLGGHTVPADEARQGTFVVRHDRAAGLCLLGEIDARTHSLMELAAELPAVLPPHAHADLLALLPTLQPRVELALPTKLRGRLLTASSDTVVRLDPMDDGGLRVTLSVRPIASGPVYVAGEGPDLVLGLSGTDRGYAQRDRDAEIARAEALRSSLGLHDAYSEGPFRYAIDSSEDALDLLAELSRRADEVQVEWPEGATPWGIARHAGTRDLRVSVRRAESWLGVEGQIEIEGSKVELSQLLDAVRAGKRWVRLGKNRFARLEDDLRKRLEQADLSIFETKKGLALGKGAVAAVRDLVEDRSQLEGDSTFDALLRRVDTLPSTEPELPEGLAAELRSYQVEGYRWLARLAHVGTGALLADEMGLGKTLQALALVLARKDEGPSLVVTPTSVADNWRAEAERFAPGLRVVTYQGVKRKTLRENLGPGDLFVTSYDLLARDATELSTIEFGTAVFDEAQVLKNARTRRAKAATSIKADFRVALTGTPIENHLGELWSAFDVVSPGLLGSWSHFRDRFAGPIERSGDERRREALRTRLAPFLLRRTKAEVAPELPPRTEVVRTVELGAAESLLYEAARNEAVSELVGKKGPDSEKRFAVLAAITRLRQLACHPRLIDPTSPVTSSKLTSFLELVDDLRQDGHRALVFSQFTSHLGLVRDALDRHGVASLYLDGKTPARERAKLVQRFQAGDEPLFLISLKAGGTGLNLTAADYVIHLDPWWNPAAEDQASDRAHRIGQTKPVTVVRLLAKGTIEEAVVKLHDEKRNLANAILEGTSGVAKANADELLELIRVGTTETIGTEGFADEA